MWQPRLAHEPRSAAMPGRVRPARPASPLLALQRSAGNHAARRLIQTKLKVSQPGDRDEQDADRVADEVLRGRAAAPCACGGTCDDCAKTVQRSAASPGAAPDTVSASPEIALGGGRLLEPGVRAFFESRLDHDLSAVRVHTEAPATTAARAFGARAFTLGHKVVFAENEYAPTTRAGAHLLAHELAHVVQQDRMRRAGNPGADASLMRSPAAPILDFDAIADRIYKAIAGPGTDEEAVYRALQLLDRDPDAIRQLEAAYRRRTHNQVTLLEDIYDDFSGTEREYALQLLNRGQAGSAQRIEAGPTDVRVAAARIREAVEGPGTDEEAIFAVLLPFHRDTLALQTEYVRQYGEDLRDRLVDEMSGSELDYALELLETPYEYYIHEGNERLAGAPFGSFGDLALFCLPEEVQTSAGYKRIYWYDPDFWEPDVDPGKGGGPKSCKVKLLTGKSPSAAIDAMFSHQERWKIACAEFVQIVHLYALRHTLGATRFDARFSGKFTLEVRRRESPGVETAVAFARKGPAESMVRSDTGQADPRSVDNILAAAPIGSRVRWTNLIGARDTGNPWEHENTIKLGPDKFGAHGTASGLFTSDNTHTRAEVELLTARGTNPDADAAYVKANIFISEIEVFKDPSRVPPAPELTKEQFAGMAMAFLDTLREQVASERRAGKAAVEEGAAKAAAEPQLRAIRLAEAGRKAAAVLNQATLQGHLAKARSVYEAQKKNFGAETAIQGELRERYMRCLAELRAAFDDAIDYVRDAWDLRDAERQAYGVSLVRWLEASPFSDAALAGRTRFTPAEAAASTMHETEFDKVVGHLLPSINLAAPGAIAQARAAIAGASNVVSAGPEGSLAARKMSGDVAARAQAALDTLQKAAETITRAIAQLGAAATAVDAWIAAPAPGATADALGTYFHITDAGYATLLSDRLKLMQRQLAGGGELYAHLQIPGDWTCSGTNTLGQFKGAYEFVFCGGFTNADRDALTVIHELAHAVVPAKGSRQRQRGGYPLDRAYPGERLLALLSTEEALANAESYAAIVNVLGGSTYQMKTIHRDRVTGCTDPAPVLRAVALAQSRARRADTYASEWAAELARTHTVPADARAAVDKAFGPTNDAAIAEILADWGTIHAEGTIFHIPHDFVCETDAKACPAGVLAFTQERTYSATSTARRAKPLKKSLAAFCPAFFQLGEDDRARVAFALVVLEFGERLLKRPRDIYAYADMAETIWKEDIPPPVAKSLQEHLAADVEAGAGKKP